MAIRESTSARKARIVQTADRKAGTDAGAAAQTTPSTGASGRRSAPAGIEEARGCYAAIGAALGLLRTANTALLHGAEDEDWDLPGIWETLQAAKARIDQAFTFAFDVPSESPFDSEAQDIGFDLYIVFDVVLVVAAVIDSEELPSGEHVTHCPTSGALQSALRLLESSYCKLDKLLTKYEAGGAA